MKYSSCLIALILGTVPVCAQQEVQLNTVPFEVANPTFHIQQVMDERTEKHLGEHKDLEGNTIELVLQGGAFHAVKAFLAPSLSPTENSDPVYLRIEALNVQESKRRMNELITRVARAHVSLVFLERTENGLEEVFRIQHNEDQVFYLTDRETLFATHEQRIRAALEYCVLAFAADREARLSAQPVAKHFSPNGSEDVFEAKLGNWFNIVTARVMNSTYRQGWSVSYTGFMDSDRGFILPYELSYEEETVKSNFAEDEGYRDVQLRIIRPRFYYVYKKLVPGVYAALSLSTPIGYEELTETNGTDSFNFIIGAGASQGIRIIPWQKFGIVFGVDFLQQVQTSRVYKHDLGFEWMIGVNF